MGSEKMFGTSHPSTLRSYSNHAMLLLEQGRNREAEILLRDILDRSEHDDGKNNETAEGRSHIVALVKQMASGNVKINSAFEAEGGRSAEVALKNDGAGAQNVGCWNCSNLQHPNLDTSPANACRFAEDASSCKFPDTLIDYEALIEKKKKKKKKKILCVDT